MCCILCCFKPKCVKILLFIVSILLLVRNQFYLYLGMLSCSYLHSCSTKGKRNHWNCGRNHRTRYKDIHLLCCHCYRSNHYIFDALDLVNNLLEILLLSLAHGDLSNTLHNIFLIRRYSLTIS